MAGLNRINMPRGVRCIMGMRELGTKVNWRCASLYEEFFLLSRSLFPDGCHSLRVLIILYQEPEIQGYFSCDSSPIFNL